MFLLKWAEYSNLHLLIYNGWCIYKIPVSYDILIYNLLGLVIWILTDSYLFNFLHNGKIKLEQLERLRSEDSPRRLMITHTIESYWIPSEKKTKSKLQI